MKLGPFNFRRSLPRDRETAGRLIEALEGKNLPAFAENHAVTLAHLMVSANDGGRTPLRVAVEKGELDQVVAALKFSKEKLTVETFTSRIPNGFGEETLLTVAAQEGQLDRVAEVLKLSGQKLTLKELLAYRFFGNPFERSLTYGHFEQVTQIIKDSGEKLTLEMLLKRGPFENLLEKVVEGRAVGKLLALLNADGVRLTPEHFLAMGSFKETLLQKLIQSKSLDQVFTPSNWAGHLDEMEALWRHVPEADRAQVDYRALSVQAILLSVEASEKMKAGDFREARRGMTVETGSPAPAKERV